MKAGDMLQVHKTGGKLTEVCYAPDMCKSRQ